MSFDTRETEVSMVGHIGSDSGNTTDAKVAYTYLEYDCGILVTITTTLPNTRALLEHTNKRTKLMIKTCEGGVFGFRYNEKIINGEF